MEQVMRRQDLAEADLICLMCGRMIGQLSGFVSRDVREERALLSTLRWISFRAASGDRPTALFTGRERFRCPECGGAAIMEPISVSAMRESVGAGDACPVHRERMQGRGRRPRGCLCNEVRVAA